MEVLSPGTRRLDRTVKLAAYRDAGVSEVWFADPRPRTIQVLVLSAGGKEYVERGVYGMVHLCAFAPRAPGTLPHGSPKLESTLVIPREVPWISTTLISTT